MIAFDFVGHLPETERGSQYIMLVVDLFSRHAKRYLLSKKERNAQGCTSRIASDYVPRWGCPHNFPSDQGTEFIFEVSLAVYEMLGAAKRSTCSYHHAFNGLVEIPNDTLCQLLAHVVNDKHKNWDEMLHVISAHNNVSRGIGLSPSEGTHWALPLVSHGWFSSSRSKGESKPQKRSSTICTAAEKATAESIMNCYGKKT